MTIDQAIDQVLALGIEDILNRASFDERRTLFQSLEAYFRKNTRKKSSPDIESKIEIFSKKIEKMAMSVQFKVKMEDGNVIIVSDDQKDEETLLFLERGSEWFEGRDIGNAILELFTQH